MQNERYTLEKVILKIWALNSFSFGRGTHLFAFIMCPIEMYRKKVHWPLCKPMARFFLISNGCHGQTRRHKVLKFSEFSCEWCIFHSTFTKHQNFQGFCAQPQKRPRSLIWHKTRFFEKTKGRIFSKPSKMVSLTSNT